MNITVQTFLSKINLHLWTLRINENNQYSVTITPIWRFQQFKVKRHKAENAVPPEAAK